MCYNISANLKLRRMQMKLSSIPDVFIPKITSGNITKKYTADIEVENTVDKSRRNLMIAGATVGAAICASLLIGYRKGVTPKTLATNTIQKVKTAYRKRHPEKDPLLKLIGNSRDKAALRKYEAYIADKKSKSLTKKFLDGEFSKKPDIVIKKILKNNSNFHELIVRTTGYEV